MFDKDNKFGFINNNESNNSNSSDIKKYIDDNTVIHPLPVYEISENPSMITYIVNIMDLKKLTTYGAIRDMNSTKYQRYRFVYICDDGKKKTIVNTGDDINDTTFRVYHYGTSSTLTFNNKIYSINYTNHNTSTDVIVTESIQKYLGIYNTQEYTPTENYHPSTKKYVDDKIKNDLGDEELTTVNKDIKGAINEVNAQYKDIVKEKADKDEVRMKNTNITLNDCDSNMLSAIQGGQGTSFELLSIPRDGSVTPEKTNFLQANYKTSDVAQDRPNLFNASKVTINKCVSTEQGTSINDLIEPKNNAYAISDIITLKKNTVYTYSPSYRWDRVATFDLWIPSGTYYGYISTTSNDDGSYSITTPNDEGVENYLVRIQFTQDDYNNSVNKFKFVEGNSLTYEVLTQEISEIKIPKLITNKTNIESWYKGKKIATYGDSLTAMNYWQPFVKKYFNTGEIVNCGVGGSTIANISESDRTDYMSGDDRINSIPSDVDVILFEGGRNDWSYNLNIGSMAKGTESLDNTTFYGAYQMTLAKLIKKFPNTLILCWNIPNGSIWEDQGEVDVPPINWNRTIRDLCKIEEDICGEYGIPMIDVNGTAGFSFVNSKKYVEDGVHFNKTIGAKAVATAIIRGMERYEPINFN